MTEGEGQSSMDVRVDGFLRHHLGDLPNFEELSNLAHRFSITGRIEVARIFFHARREDKLDTAIPLVQEALDSVFGDQPEDVRGDISSPENQRTFSGIYRDCEIDATPSYSH